MTISVVGRIEGQVSRTQATVVVSSQFERVHHGRIALQGHAMVQAIDENARNDGPLFRLSAFRAPPAMQVSPASRSGRPERLGC